MKSILLAAALVWPVGALAQGSALIDITDPEGDDVGDGTLVYPRDSAFAPGDLDLRGLRVFGEGDGLRFEATFRNPIRHPSTVKASGLGSEDLSLFARRGFYAFNLDLYIDTDRVAGSGRTDTLPGRGARIAPEHAWEKAIVLTPRPELMRRQMHDVQAQSPPTGQAAAAADIDRSVFFATDVRVRGRSVSFTVPRSFIGSLNAADWSLTAVVTAAKLQIEAGITLGKASGAEHVTLGVQPPAAGRPETAMGYGGDRAPATAIVDLLAPDGRLQAAQLAPGAQLIGLNRDNRFGAAVTLPPAPAPAVAPAAAPMPAPARSTPPVAAVPAPAASPAAPTRPAAAPGTPAAPVAAASAPAAPRPRDAAFFEEQELRLRALKRLRDGGLISEDEYQQKRREILEKL